MSDLQRTIDTYGVTQLLDHEHLFSFYDADQLHPDMSVTEDVELYVPFYPVIVGNRRNFFEKDKTSYIPILDDESKPHTYMGVLVAQSQIVPELLIVEHLPYPTEVPLPTRILTTFGNNITYPPIRGFMLQRRQSNPNKADIALLVGESRQEVQAVTRRRQHGANTLAALVLRTANKAIRLNEARLKAKQATKQDLAS